MSLLDSILDDELDGVEAAPEFVDYPNGAYLLDITRVDAKEYIGKVDDKGIKKDDGVRVVITYALNEVVQLADDKDVAPVEGSLTSESFIVSNVTGQQYWVLYLDNVFGGDRTRKSIRANMQELEGLRISAICTTRNGFFGTSRQSVV